MVWNFVRIEPMIEDLLKTHYLIDPDANSISIFTIILISDSLERRNHVVKVV